MGKFVDLTGKKFNRLYVVEKLDTRGKYGDVYWLCKCDCGNTIKTTSYNLTSNHTTSCGCYGYSVKMNNGKKACIHGKRNTRIYNTWEHLKQRCYNANNCGYKNYGGRGIKVCDEWLDKEKGFINFYNWAINNGYQDDLTIDRTDVNGNYEPNNCRWVTTKMQNNNKRNLHYITYKGETLTLAKWSERLDIKYDTLERRINKYNWSVEKAFSTPTKEKRVKK